MRFKNTSDSNAYLTGTKRETKDFELLEAKDDLIERFFLGLRTDRGVDQLSTFETILVPRYREKLTSYQEEGLLDFPDEHLVLTDEGMDVFNSIVTELMSEI